MESIYPVFLVALVYSIIQFTQFIIAGLGPFYDPKIYWPTFIRSNNFTKEYFKQVTKMIAVPMLASEH